MKTKTYKLIRFDGDKTTSNFCTSYSLQKIVNNFVEEDIGTLTIITIHQEEPNTKVNLDIFEKQNYYKSKYSTYYKQYKNNKITK